MLRGVMGPRSGEEGECCCGIRPSVCRPWLPPAHPPLARALLHCAAAPPPQNGKDAYMIHFTYGDDFNEMGVFTPGKVGYWHWDKRDYMVRVCGGGAGALGARSPTLVR